jgi:hypothetical protein
MKPKPCKIKNSTCKYRACMSNDCQKEYAQKNGALWVGDCEKSK